MPQISILGCGWLGFPLAKTLLENGFSVKGSTTSEEKLLILKQSAIESYAIILKEDGIVGDFNAFLENSEILIIDIPPKLRGEHKENFVSKIRNIIPFIENSSVTKVLFISSTAVYKDENALVDEDTFPDPDTESSKQLLESELVLSQADFETSIIRFGGLIGDGRHPVRFLSGRKNIENPNAPINLIHQEDCIGIIISVVKLHAWNEIFNAVAPFHPTREEYYVKKAVALGLDLPEFNYLNSSVGKTISSEKIQNRLKYTFKRITTF